MSTSGRLDDLRRHGVGFIAGVPCSYLRKFLAGCTALPPNTFLPAVREDHAVAAAGGYRWARRCQAPQPDSLALEQWLLAPGPAFLGVAISLDDPPPAPRIPMTPAEMARRFRAVLG